LFTNQGNSRSVDVGIFVYPDAAAAVQARDLTVTGLTDPDIGVKGGTPTPVDVGGGGTMAIGTTTKPDGPKSKASVIFAEGKATVTINFESPANDPVPQDFVLDIARKQDAAIKAGVKRAVVVSSNSPCGCNPHPDHLFDEKSPYHPYMNYGRSKMQMELAIKERQQQGKIETVILRPPWFYGPNQPPRQTLFFQMVRDGKGPIVGSGENLRSMGYIDNLCQGLLLAALVEQANGRVYWLADKRPYSMNEVIDTIERLLENEFGQQCAHKRMRLPGFASEIALVADASLQALGMYHQKIHVLSEMNKTIACSVALAEKELGYRPAIALEEGMRRSMQWCVEQGIKF